MGAAVPAARAAGVGSTTSCGRCVWRCDVVLGVQEALPPRKVATQALDTLALGLPAKLVAPAALEFVEQGVQQADAGARVAACSVLAVLSEGCADALRTRDRFAALLPAVTQCTADADPGVRAAAATCIGEMACALPRFRMHAHRIAPEHASAWFANPTTACSQAREVRIIARGGKLGGGPDCVESVARANGGVRLQVTCSRRCQSTAMW